MSATQNIAHNKAVVEKLYAEVIDKQNVSAIDALVDLAVTIHDPMMGEMHGIDAFRQFIAAFLTGFPQQRADIELLVAENDLVAALHTHIAVNTGSFMGLPPTGKAVEVRGIELFRITNGKITELWRHDDDAGLLRQLGVIPAAATA